LGLDPRCVAGNPFSAYLHPEDEAWARDLRMAWGRGAKRSSREIRVRHADGSWLWFGAVAADLLDDPDVRGVATYLHDLAGGGS
jgi:PAS domain-containing protein